MYFFTCDVGVRFNSRLFTAIRSCLFAILALSFVYPGKANAQPAPVPSVFQDLYTSLNDSLVSFNTTLSNVGTGSSYPVLHTAVLTEASSITGPAQVEYFDILQAQLQAMKAMGVQAIEVECDFPMLYRPFFSSQTQFQQFVDFYAQVAGAVRAQGLKLIVESETLPTKDVPAGGWDVAPFYATLNWVQYQQARTQTAQLIAQTMQPDYMVVMNEPDTEANQSGQQDINTVSGATSLLSQLLVGLQQAGVPGMKVGAGVGTWSPNSLAFVQSFVAMPVDFIDMHVFPVNGAYLPNALNIANIAAAAGKPVSITQCWLNKVRDSELGVISDGTVRDRDPFDFWAPLDAYFVQTMEILANQTQMIFLAPSTTPIWNAYLPYNIYYDQQSDILAAEIQQARQNIDQASFTSTGMAYYNSNVSPPDTVPPTVPTGLTAVFTNPTTALITWNAATDNVGVAGYYVLRNGTSAVAVTASQTFLDSGLTNAAHDTYAVASFDLAGNVSEFSNIGIIGPDPTPPSSPSNVVVRVVGHTQVILSWSPPTDGSVVTGYLIFFGLSPISLYQAAILPGTATSYVLNGLSPATTFYIGLAAVNRIGTSPIVIVGVTIPALPVAPSNLTATPISPTKVRLTWSPSTGGLPIAYYLVYRGNSPSSLSQVAIVNKTSYTDVMLSPSTTYYYAVQAEDTGTPPTRSGLSPPVSVTTFSPPSAPVLTVTLISCTKVILAWTPSISGGLPIANYRVYKGTSPSNLVQLAVTTKTSYTDASDTGGMTYYYAVQAVDIGGDASPISPPVSITLYACPSAPANLVATPVSSTRVRLTWSPSTGGLPIAFYRVYRGTIPGNLTQMAVTTKTTYTDTTVTAATSYFYALQAVDTQGDVSMMTATVQVTTPE
jgi:fibronectin type 3 domain-containing protein